MMPSVHFSSTIRLVSPQEFGEQFNPDTMKRFRLTDDWTHKGRVTHAKTVGSFLAHDCIIVGMTNGSHAALAHLDPKHYDMWEHSRDSRLENPEEIRKALAEDLKRLQAENPNVRAFIAGGNPFQESRKLRVLLEDMFSKEGIPVSMLCQQEDSFTNVLYDTATDTWTVSARRDTANKAATSERLKANFRKIHIDEGDALFIGDQKINPAEVNNA